ncbi:tetratricopeptide repeat protein [Azospirillum doebereinerae]|uniref:protein O-GlcNAc transferase n=1 Tax=Azospirillum doebereinerae TaxID=92933 RepID=A0A433J2M6_9PROT|nr:tetratricopeptide repeat protein [Azospirillum doebereinerae]RUQ65963.1 tetratricopeptide repeat protein [Azospirillum doebereinerae]
MASIGEALGIALDLHQAGRVDEARTLYGRILDADPQQADAHHLLGVLLGQCGDSDGAGASIARAVALNPARSDFHLNLANLRRASAAIDDAGRHYAHALALRPDNPEAAARLGAIRAGQGVEEPALALADSVLDNAQAVSVEALTALGIAIGRFDGREETAAALLDRSAAREPASAAVQAQLGLLRQRQGRLDAAAVHYRAALRQRAEFPAVLNALGALALDAGRLDEATACFTRQAASDPADPEPYRWLGRLHRSRGRSGEAASVLAQAEALAPGDRDTGVALAVTLLTLKRPDEAEAVLAALAGAGPDDPLVLYNLGQARAARKDPDAALAAFRLAVALAPDVGDLLHALGNGLTGIGCARQGARWLERALPLGGERVDWHRSAMLAVLYVPGVDPERRFALHRRLEMVTAAPAPLARPSVTPDPERRLRVGYLTSDLRAFQPIARNTLPLFENRDRAGFEVTVYAHVLEPDGTTQRFRALSDRWRDIAQLDDATVASLIRDDGIDVLVALGIRFDHNRPQVCRYRPAPVQVGFHDAATSGLSEIGYIVTDRVMTPRHGTERFTERPLRLPSFYLAAIPADAPPVGPPPMLRDGVTRFGCFNNPAKISDETLDLWARVMGAVPDSVLVLNYLDAYRSRRCVGRIRDRLAAGGIDPERLRIGPTEIEHPAAHLARYAGIDIALDPFPFCGSTTTFEALAMGVPVVTLPQDTMVSRWSASMLRALGLDELVAGSGDAYVAIAAALAGDPARLSALRAGLRGRLAASPLCDGRRRARQMERLYRAVWRRWCRQQG